MQDYRIAGLRVRMESFGRTATQAEPYRAEFEGEPDLLVTGDPEPLQLRQPHLSLDDCEYLTTGGSFYRQLLLHNGMMLHASAVVMDGFAYLFSAPCGTGKSTHTSLWMEAFGTDRVTMLNDDKPALRLEDGRWYAYGTPWSGKHDVSANLRAPLGGICVLRRGAENQISPYGGAKVVFDLLEQTARPYGGEARGRLLELLSALLETVPVWKLICTPTTDAALLAHGAMSAEAEKRWNPSLFPKGR